MNILHHKSWHVRTKKNMEKVRRDEEKAAEIEKEKQRKIALAEQEARTELLRSRSRAKSIATDTDSATPTLPSAQDSPCGIQGQSNSLDVFTARSSKDVSVPGLGDKTEHINFFKDLEDGLTKQGKNKDHEAEKRKEQEEFEKKLGLLTYLGQTALEEKETGLWYLKKSQKRKKKKKKSDSESEQEDEDKELQLKLALQEKRRQSLDPLLEMREIMHKKKKHKKHKKEKRKDKDKESRRHSASSKHSSQPSSSTPNSSSLDKLRAERIARERQEQMRTQALLRKNKDASSGKGRQKGASSSDDSEDETRKVSHGKRRYNSQYNPEFVPESKKRRQDPFL